MRPKFWAWLISGYYREHQSFKASVNSDVGKYMKYFRERCSAGKLGKSIELRLKAIIFLRFVFMYSSIGSHLKRVRKKYGLSVGDISCATGYSFYSVIQMEAGQLGVSFNFVNLLCDKFDVDDRDSEKIKGIAFIEDYFSCNNLSDLSSDSLIRLVEIVGELSGADKAA